MGLEEDGNGSAGETREQMKRYYLSGTGTKEVLWI